MSIRIAEVYNFNSLHAAAANEPLKNEWILLYTIPPGAKACVYKDKELSPIAAAVRRKLAPFSKRLQSRCPRPSRVAIARARSPQYSCHRCWLKISLTTTSESNSIMIAQHGDFGHDTNENSSRAEKRNRFQHSTRGLKLLLCLRYHVAQSCYEALHRGSVKGYAPLPRRAPKVNSRPVPRFVQSAQNAPGTSAVASVVQRCSKRRFHPLQQRRTHFVLQV